MVLPTIIETGKRSEDLEPNLGPFEFYIDAFKEVSTCRPVGMGAAPIPFTAIVEYARIYKIDEFEEFKYIIRRLDKVLLEKDDSNANNGSQKDNSKV